MAERQAPNASWTQKRSWRGAAVAIALAVGTYTAWEASSAREEPATIAAPATATVAALRTDPSTPAATEVAALAVAPSTRPAPPPRADADPAAGLRLPDRATAEAAAFRSLDGKQTFRVPQPDDPEWRDYVEMLHHPRFRSALTNAPGRALPYDPEWRSEVSGRRQATPVEGELQGGAATAEELASALLAALRRGDRAALERLLVTEDEFRTFFWPEFPQSRPYLKVPTGEAWGFHRATQAENVGAAIDALRGRSLDLEGVELARRMDFTNFTMVRDVVLWTRDAETGARLGLRIVPTFVERHGRWKAYAFGKENRLAPLGSGQ